MQGAAFLQLLDGVAGRLDAVIRDEDVIVRLPVPRMPVGNQSSIVVVSSRGTMNMWPSPSGPAGALKISHSEKSEPLQKPQLPVRRFPPATRTALALGLRLVLPASVA